MRTLKTVLILLLCAAAALAEGTQIWRQSKFEEFEKGSATGVAIRSDGSLVLAPSFKLLVTTPSTYLWAMVADAQGNVYVAAGSPARVYRITPDGHATAIFKAQELEVQALAVAPDGSLYAATSPDGKVYKIERKAAASAAAPAAAGKDADEIPLDPGWSSSVFFDPQTKYIWDLALDREGRLYVATGEHGQIFRVTPAGAGSLFFQSDEAHIRCLAFDPKGNLIAGSDGSGLIYRISPAGDAFVLYSASKKEITALAVDDAGNIYAAGVGDKKPAGIVPGMPVTMPVATPAPTAPTVPQRPGAAAPGTTAPGGVGFIPFFPGFTQGLGSEVYVIAPDGSPKVLWASREDIVYALAFDPRGRLLAATGNKGHVYLIENDQEFTDLLAASANQVTAFAKAPNGGLYASTSNLGKIFLLGAGPDSDGTYESDVFDAKIFSLWGRAEVRGSGNFDFYARSGNVDNPDRNWSPWKKVDLAQGAALDVPPARFIQWKAVLHPTGAAPRIGTVGLNYLSKNVAPDLDDISVQVGVRYISQPRPAGGEGALVVTGGGGATAQIPPKFEAPIPALRDRDSIGVRWSVRDDNDDTLVYSLYYRGDGETQWKLLKDEISDKYYSFDAGLLPDGGYTLKVVASDAPSHSPDEALTTSLESDRFEVDNTPPAVEALSAVEAGGELHVTFRAADSFSPIKRAEYSVDASDWQYIEPLGRLSDSKTESYDFHIPVPPNGPVLHHSDQGSSKTAGGEHVVVVRVYDRFENMGTGKVVVRGK